MRWMLVTLIVAVWASLSFGIGGDMGVGAEPLTDGSEAYPWLIEDFDDFQVFCGNSSYWDDYTRLECDLDLDPALPGRVAYATAVIAPDTDQNTEWFQGVAYSGVFDGAGHRILNLTLSTPTWSCNYLSLFGKVDTQGRICHLTLESVNIHSGSQGLFVGGVSGINLGCLSDCHVTGEIGLHHWAIERVGGLCGGNNNAGLIENCSAQIIISSYYEQTSCGGLVGYINGGIINDSYTNISLTTGSESTDTGGLCGYISNGSINRCHVSGTVTSEENTGGLCGYSFNSTISECYTECQVNGYAQVGGLCGECESTTISYSYATGDVVASRSYIGGLIGLARINTMYRCYCTGEVSGFQMVGGLFGQVSESQLTQCFYSGSVTGDSYVGGLCGLAGASIIQCYSTGSVTGDRDVGGLCSDNSFNDIKQCYSDAVVSGNTRVGGICGYDAYGNVIDCFWNIDNAPDATSRVGWELTSSQMTQAASYLGWTDGSWTIDEGVAPPRLAWENQPGTPITTDWSGFPPTYTGSGTYGDPYQISTAADLQCLQRRTPDWSKYFILVNDIDLSGVTFDRSVIAPGSYFTGSFNGQGNRIANLTIDAANQQAVGFVNRLDSNGRITDLELLNVFISGDRFVAGICANGSDGTITRCTVTGQIRGHVDSGGICGTTGEISLSQCCFIGDIDVSGINIYYRGYAGGICGGLGYKSTIYQSCAIADISALTYSTCYVGGICGINSGGEIRQCYASGTITAVSLDEDEYIGGVCGLLGGTQFYNDNAKVEYCFWDAQISGIDIPCVLADPYPGTFTNVEGLTTAEMQSLEPYADGGWSIGYGYGAATTWWLPVNTTPRLSWQAPLVGISYTPSLITLGWDQTNQVTFELYSPLEGKLLNWTITGFETCPWITQVTPSSGVSTGPLDTTTVTIDIDANGNESGYYECMLAITDQTGAGIYLPIMVNILLAGDGSENAPYRIESFEDFALFADPVNAATYWAADVHTLLACDIDLDPLLPGRKVYIQAPVAPDTDSVSDWFQGNPYNGVLDGNGHRILNLTINTGGVVADYLSFIGKMDGNATVKNLGIEEMSIVGSNGSYFLAGLCGMNYGHISSCYVEGTITGMDTTTNIGGLCGVNHETGHITNCYIDVALVSGVGSLQVGGLCGKLNHGVITDSYAAGTISAGSGSNNVGSFYGLNDNGVLAGNFWDTTTSGIADPEAGQPDTDGLMGKTTAEMQQMSTFAGNPANWDFVDETINGVEDHWRMCVDGVDYPRLRWEFTTGDLSCPDGVDLVDVAVMAANWLESDCITNPAACGYADLDGLGTVDIADLVIMAEYWLEGI